MGEINKEYKTFRFEVKAVDDEKGLIEAYGSVFSNIDQGNDVVDKGSFKRTIKNSKSRVDANKANFLATMLWNHDTEHFLPIGGWYDLEEDDHGLLGKGKIIIETQLGRDVYTLIKEKVINEFSIGYEVMPGGSYYEKSTGVRHLTELRLWEISPVVFAMNQEALLVGVKSMDLEQKTICGNTSGSIGPRDEAWDGSKAEKWIWSKALDDDGKVKSAIAKKYFMKLDGDPTLKGSYGYAFWIDDHISVGGVKAVANALSGARNADAGEDTAGMKKKVETLYRRINAKYKDDTPLTPPWEDDGKGNNRRMERKTFTEHYNEEMAQDLLEDWQDVYVCALTCAIFDAFTIGDQPEQDISEALDAFKETVLSKFVAQGVECGLSDYLEGHGYSYTPGLTTMQNGSDDGRSGYGWMSRSNDLQQKAGKPISAANQKIIDDHVKSMKAMAKQAKADMQAHTDSMHDAVDDMAGNDSGKSLGTLAQKAGRSISADNADKLHDMADKAMSIMQEHTKALSKAANGLANAVKPPVSNTDGEDPKDDEDQQVEKSMRDALKELKALSA